MAYNPYTAPRSTTPPLYYRRPEGVAPSYYTVPAQREVSSLSIPSYPTPRLSSARHDDHPQHGAPGTAAVQGPPPPPSHVVANPFSNAGPTELFRPSDSGIYGGGSGVGSGRWSYQQQPRQDEERRRVAQLEAEEAALAAEEAALRARQSDLQMVRRRQEEEQLQLSKGWFTLLEREERYYTEPVPDYSPDIAARELHCTALHEQLQQAESHRNHLETQLSNYEYVLREKEAVESEVTRVREGLQGIEQRRRACIARAERFFDVETKRVVEANRAVRKLDVQLKDLTSSGPLAQLQCTSSASRSQSRCVSFAPADKSVVIDIGRNGSLSTSVSAEPGRGDTQGLSQEEESSSANSRLPQHPPQQLQAQGSHGGKAAQLGGASVCLGLEEDEECGMGLGGTSVAFSLNNSAPDALSKRRKVELAI